MKHIQFYHIAPTIPPELKFLETLSKNLWWSWNVLAKELFRRINPNLWKNSENNPLRFLNTIPQKRLVQLAKDDGFLTHLDEVKQLFTSEINNFDNIKETIKPECIAYFSLEYGLHESVNIYSGGLGVLAGDHLKSASDLDIPLVAIGLLYREGYFLQYLNSDGMQQERYPNNNLQYLPLAKACGKGETSQLKIQIPLPGGALHAVVWQVNVGKVPLFLLDTNIEENTPERQDVTSQLYCGDRHLRLQQELLLGIGGFQALIELGYEPHAFHINEGHASFLNIARINYLIAEKKLDLNTALEIVQRTNIFTTHTPVPAGNESFKANQLNPYLETLCDKMQFSPKQIYQWAQMEGDKNHNTEFSMTIFGLRMAQYSNGVSRLHGKISRKMWHYLWPEHPEDEVPINHITNGVHVTSWVSDKNAALYTRYIGPEWRVGPLNEAMLSRIEQIPDEELWLTHCLERSRLIAFSREHIEKSHKARNAHISQIQRTKSVFDNDALTIGFARRFATYKRATLLLKDYNRLKEILTNSEYPVQIIFAGKAHPADEFGKDFIKQVYLLTKDSDIDHHVLFLENYNINVARQMVQGVDIWLNTPRRPQEASGTSGMKVAINGGINVSILDGWWCEGYNKNCGWAIGHGEEYDNHDYQDTVESQALYNLLENEIIPCFYDRDEGNIPRKWIRMMKESIKIGISDYSSHRMLTDYNVSSYKPAVQSYKILLREEASSALELNQKRDQLHIHWGQIEVKEPKANKELSTLRVGDSFVVTTNVFLGEISPEDINVEIYYGPLDSHNKISKSHFVIMSVNNSTGDGYYDYQQVLKCKFTGRYGFTTRVVPNCKLWKDTMPGLIIWASSD